MNRLSKLAIVAAGFALAGQSALAVNNDLILSINNNSGSGTTEFTVDLGNVSTLTGPNQDLSSFMSTFNSQYASAAASGLNVGVIAGQNGQGGFANPGQGNDVFTTTLRTGGGSYSVAGSSAPGPAPSSSFIASAGGVASGFVGFGANKAVSDPDSFTVNIAKDPNSPGTGNPSYVGYLGTADNPLHSMTGSSIVLDFWKDTQTDGSGTTSGWVYQGDFTVDLSGGTPSLVWDVAPVPEPSTYGLFAGVGLLALSLRRRFRGKTA